MSTLPTHDEVTVAVTLSTSSATFVLSSDSPSFETFVHARLVRSTRPGQSITMAIDDTAFEGASIAKGFNAAATGAFGAGFISTHDPERVIGFGFFKSHYSQANVHKPNLLHVDDHR